MKLTNGIVGAITGGLIGLIWSMLPFLLPVLKIFYIGINFLILPFFIFGTWLWFLFSKYKDDFYAQERLSNPFFILISAWIGAWIGFLISGFIKYDLSQLPLIMIGFAIAAAMVIAAIPVLVWLLIFEAIVLQIIVILHWQDLLTYTPLIYALPSLLAIPALIFFGYKAGDFIGEKLKKARLKLIEEQIKNIEDVVKKHETVLTQRKEMEKNIERIVAIDPYNLRLKADLFRKQAKELDTDGINKRIIEIDGEIQKLDKLRKKVEEKLYALEKEKEKLEIRLEDIGKTLHRLEVVDPANVKIKMQKLQKEWEELNREEIKKIEPVGELETLFREQLLLNFQIEDKNSEIENQRKERSHFDLTIDALQLEKYILELEILDRKIKSEEPRLFELRDKLGDLQSERNRIEQSLNNKKQS